MVPRASDATTSARRAPIMGPPEHRPDSVTAMTVLQPAPLCLLSVHAHPDDEASKGAPTVAKYHAEGRRTLLVCCTGGEEGVLQNPALREEGGPFFGLTPEQEK